VAVKVILRYSKYYNVDRRKIISVKRSRRAVKDLLEFCSDVLEERSGSVQHVRELRRRSGRGWSRGKLFLNQLSYPTCHGSRCRRQV